MYKVTVTRTNGANKYTEVYEFESKADATIAVHAMERAKNTEASWVKKIK